MDVAGAKRGKIRKSRKNSLVVHLISWDEHPSLTNLL